jgi:hypothetical protein
MKQDKALTPDDLQQQIGDLQYRVGKLEREQAQTLKNIEDNDDFALGINDLLSLLAESLFRHHPYLLKDIEPSLEKAYRAWERYQQGNPTEDDLLEPVERYQAKRHLYTMLLMLGKTNEKSHLDK